jgi:hypothetical protein
MGFTCHRMENKKMILRIGKSVFVERLQKEK